MEYITIEPTRDGSVVDVGWWCLAATELDVLIEHSRYMVLLSKVYYKQENLADSQTYLNKARELQSR